MQSRPYIVILGTLCALAVGAAGCDSDTHHKASDPSAKPMMLREASLGFGTFHRFIWIPAQKHRFSHPNSPAVAKARSAARYASHQLRVAARHVRSSKRLRVLFAPLELTADKISALRGALSGHHTVARIEAINQILRSIAAAAKDNGARIIEAPAAQIAAAGGPDA